jgi:hypothetical protein
MNEIRYNRGWTFVDFIDMFWKIAMVLAAFAYVVEVGIEKIEKVYLIGKQFLTAIDSLAVRLVWCS